MRAAVSRVVRVNQDVSRQFPLNSEIPLIDLRVPESVAPMIAVAIAPEGQRAIFPLLRAHKTDRERVLERGVLRDVSVLGKVYIHALVPPGSTILPVGREVHAVVDPGSTAHHRL